MEEVQSRKDLSKEQEKKLKESYKNLAKVDPKR
jgi:hypothetical protein